jgi:hypothetical protein
MGVPAVPLTSDKAHIEWVKDRIGQKATRCTWIVMKIRYSQVEEFVGAKTSGRCRVSQGVNSRNKEQNQSVSSRKFSQAGN